LSTQTPTRSRLIETAAKRFAESGFRACSLADLAKEAGVRGGSVYYFFKTKEELLLAVLDHRAEMLWPIVITPAFARTPDPIERIFALLTQYREWMLASECTFVCPIARLALELESESEKVHQKIAANFEGWRLAIRGCLKEAQDRMPGNTDLDQLARFVLTVMEGGLMQSRSQRDIAPFDDSVSQLRSYFNLLLKRNAQ
jgi:TetR/AcrR family transcriptional regulator, transcriptional repressor for nem operon